VEVVRRAVEAFRAGSRESEREAMLTVIAEVSDTSIEADTSALPLPDAAGIHRGTDAFLQFWRDWLAAWETIRFNYVLLDAGERVVVLFEQRLRGRSTGIEMTLTNAMTVTVRNGLAVHLKLHASQDEALEAAGLRD
jgi:SnoaL-like domain